jgi:DNA-binding NarL/FixJ family response regulator
LLNSLTTTNVFIVEDDAFFTELYKSEIAKYPQFNLKGSSDTGSGAVDFLKSAGTVNLLICDLHLPDMNGVEVILEAKRIQPEIAVLVITGTGQGNDFFECLNLDVKGLIQKDELPNNFGSILGSVGQGYATLSPKIAKKLLNKNAINQPLTQIAQNPLTIREREVLKLLASGLSIKLVARELGLSLHTISDHTKSIYNKLQVHSNIQAIIKGQQNRWIP